MKKTLPILLLVVTIGLIMAWLFYPNRSVNKNETRKTKSPEKITLRLGHNISTNSALHSAAEQFAQQIAEKSNGQIAISLHPNQQLGNDHQMVEMTKAGELDIILTPTAKLSLLVPAMQLADLPFYFPSRQALYDMLDKQPGRILLEKLRPHGLVGVTFWENGFKHFTANRPIRKPEDFSGLKIRVMKSRIIMDQFRTFNAHPIPIDFHATRQALSDGVVDGQENPLVAIVNMGFHQVQSHLTLSSHAYLGYVFSISANTLDKLPPSTQTLLIETARSLTTFERNETHKREKKLLEQIKQAGVTIHTLTEQEQHAFQRASNHIPMQFEPIIGADLLSITDELLLAYRPEPKPNEWIIGLDANLSIQGGQAGLSIKRGILLAIDQINQQGGILGRPLRLIARDNLGLVGRSRNNINAFAKLDNLVAVFGGMYSNIAMSVLDEIHQKKIPFMIPWAAASKITENGYQPNFVFRLSLNDRFAGPFLVDQAVKRFSKIALLLENSVWGRGNEKNMIKRLSELTMEPVTSLYFNRGEQDFTPQIMAIEQANADVIMLVANALEGEQILRGMENRNNFIPIIAHWGITGGNFAERIHNIVDKVDLQVIQTFSFFKTLSKPGQMLVERYKTLFDVESPKAIFAPVGTAHAYDLTHLLAKALQHAGTNAPDVLRVALENLPGSINGVVKKYRRPFTTEQHDALTPDDLIMARFTSEGTIMPTSPELKP
ncbi:MAG: DctP family TRAP transporter solute-binding subunit [Magnetococcales bacterium]|nr:DctP family TRAP transporter solute-binding subunit [Magnetococcales bacterium]